MIKAHTVDARASTWVRRIICILLLCVYGLSDDVAALDSLDDELMLARAIQGEGAHLFGAQRDRVGLGIAFVALKRLNAAPQGTTLRDVIEAGLYGWTNVDEPEPWAFALAEQALMSHGGTLPDLDPCPPCMYFLSGDDARALDVDLSTETWSVRSGAWSLHFFTDWPDHKEADRLGDNHQSQHSRHPPTVSRPQSNRPCMYDLTRCEAGYCDSPRGLCRLLCSVVVRP